MAGGDTSRGQIPSMSGVDAAVAALRDGHVVVLPTDTVYGLAVDPRGEEPVRRLAALKRRPTEMPIALVAADFDAILEAVPELDGRPAALATALLPGPFTLVLPNPARRFPWLTASSPGTIGIRVPDLPPSARAVLERVGAVAATSANVHGSPDPARVADIPEEIASGVGAVVDAGPLPGTPSTVVDLTERQPRVLREGAVSSAETLARIARVAAE